MVRTPQFEQVQLSVEVYGRSFDFDLCRRPVDLGPELTVQFYWMDASQVRKGIQAQEFSQKNVESCIELWWHVARKAGQQTNPAVLQQYLLAKLYPTFAASKGQQRVFLDAFPGGKKRYPIHGNFVPSNASITPRRIAKQLHELLRGELGTNESQSYANWFIGGLLAGGIRRFCENHRGGLIDFRESVEQWSKAQRRRGHSAEMTWARNLLAYQTKLAFFECYSNAWIALIDQLQAQGLDNLSVTFLDLWHFQDFDAVPDNRPSGPLGGIPLAMHPISAYLMRVPDLARTCGEFVREKAQKKWEPERLAKRQSYRHFCQAIEFAALQYRLLRSENALRDRPGDQPNETSELNQTKRRRDRESHSDQVTAIDEGTLTARTAFQSVTDFLRQRGDCCPSCRRDVKATEIVSQSENKLAVFKCRCDHCGRATNVEIDAESYAEFISPPPK